MRLHKILTNKIIFSLLLIPGVFFFMSAGPLAVIFLTVVFPLMTVKKTLGFIRQPGHFLNYVWRGIAVRTTIGAARKIATAFFGLLLSLLGFRDSASPVRLGTLL